MESDCFSYNQSASANFSPGNSDNENSELCRRYSAVTLALCYNKKTRVWSGKRIVSPSFTLEVKNTVRSENMNRQQGKRMIVGAIDQEFVREGLKKECRKKRHGGNSRIIAG